MTGQDYLFFLCLTIVLACVGFCATVAAVFNNRPVRFVLPWFIVAIASAVFCFVKLVEILR